MNLRHAAALALAFVGWNMLLPPQEKPEAPLAQWEVIATTYGSKAQCLTARSDAIQDWLILKGVPDITAAELQRFVGASLCISADDPRLKPN